MQEFVREYGKLVAAFIVYAVLMLAAFGYAFNGVGLWQYIGDNAPEPEDNLGAVAEEIMTLDTTTINIDVVNIPVINTVYYLNANTTTSSQKALFNTTKKDSTSATIRIIKVLTDSGEPVTDTQVMFKNNTKEDINNGAIGDGTINFKQAGYYTVVVESTLGSSVCRRTFKIRILD